ncbi:MerR family transcriptional regulator [Clostridium estertheticum]|uniref:MerR family transcriptional regulator n=1 Tax=Clostridium estertheticum TaxID=238834 RepID=UPI0013E919C6|nr:MerR family transcriptional regulator [Clostridium estertheticum]MBZ9686318.1 MerR family transcriptional regulator [Clostridium estertheticum]
MNSKKGEFYTAGKFAGKAGVTLRTIRYYDKKDLLKPTEYSESGYRLYSDQDFAVLQKILTLKFMGFSLEEIKMVMKEDSDKIDFKHSLHIQKHAIERKMENMAQILKAINETEQMLDSEDTLDWNKFIFIIKAINLEKISVQQFKNAANLKNRINLHDKYSTNKQGWHRWLFERIPFFKGAKILELGCGDGSFWLKNKDRLPKQCEITLTDISEGMIEDAKNNLVDMEKSFTFKVMDAQNITFQDSQFDIVIANQVIYYIQNREKVFLEINRVLKPKGVFYTATNGKNHMDELFSMVERFRDKIIFPTIKKINEFRLEDGETQLEQWFYPVQIYRYKDSLKVTEVEPLMDYVLSSPSNLNEILNEKDFEELKELFKNNIEKHGYMFITKDTGVIEAKKR